MPGDYNGDGLTDVAVFRPSNAVWYVRIGPVQWGTRRTSRCRATTTATASTDIAVFRPSNGMWFVRGQAPVQLGDPGDIPVPGDYNGDGKMDIAVYRPSTGVWYVRSVHGAVRRPRRRSRARRLQRRRRDGHRGLSAVDGTVVRAESVDGPVRDASHVPMVRIGGPQ